MGFENWNRLVAERQQQLEERSGRTSKQEGDDMTDRAKEARRAYKREWNRRNRDKVKAAQARYWERKAVAAEATADQQADGQEQQEA